MSQLHPKACYNYGPIQDLAKLAETLGISVQEVHRLCRRADQSYRLVGAKKKDGSRRATWDAQRHLKEVHARINTRLLRMVLYPLYLQGGIRDPENPRDYARNAGIHAGQACVMNEDIANFYPSITAEQVFEVWSGLFRFPPEVAAALTALTTRQGFLPQGARTSSYIANLVFWKTEPELVGYLTSKGYRYSRLTDDITVSSSQSLTAKEKSKIKSIIHSFMKRQNFARKYQKQRIFSGGARMLVNNLVVNRRPALPEEERKAVRGIVNAAIELLRNDAPVPAAQLAHVRGKLGKLQRFHPQVGKKLKSKLDSALGS